MKIRSALRVASIGLATLALAQTSFAASSKRKNTAKSSQSAGKPAAKKSTSSGKSKSARKKSVALGPITGKKTQDVREWVRAVLDEDYEVTDAEDFKPKGSNATFAKMGKDLGVDYILVGRLTQNQLTLSVRNAEDGKLVRDVKVKGRGPKLKAAIGADLGAGLADAMGDTSATGDEEGVEGQEEGAEDSAAPAAEAEAEVPAEEESAPAEEAAREEPKGATASPLVVFAGARFYRRTFTFNDTLEQVQPGAQPANRVLNYKLPLGPSLLLRLEAYPAGLLGGDGFATNLGIVGGFEQGIATKSQYRAAGSTQTLELTNDMQEWFLGGKVRLPFPGMEVGASLTYGSHKYALKGDDNLVDVSMMPLLPLVPDVKYSYAQLGVDVKARIGKLLTGGHLNGRVVFNSGELEDEMWFPNASGKAIDLGAMLGYALLDNLDILVGVDLVRYGFNFNPVPPGSATVVAGGAVDQYLSGWVGASFHLPGRDGPAAEVAAASE